MHPPFSRTYQLLAIHYTLSLTVDFWYFYKKQSLLPAIFNRNNNMYKSTLINYIIWMRLKTCQCAMSLTLKVSSHTTFKHIGVEVIANERVYEASEHTSEHTDASQVTSTICSQVAPSAFRVRRLETTFTVAQQIEGCSNHSYKSRTRFYWIADPQAR